MVIRMRALMEKLVLHRSRMMMMPAPLLHVHTLEWIILLDWPTQILQRKQIWTRNMMRMRVPCLDELLWMVV